MKMTGLDHITVNVKDLDRSKAFYGDVLGLKEAGSVQMGDHTLTYYELPQGVRLELIDYEAKEEPKDKRRRTQVPTGISAWWPHSWMRCTAPAGTRAYP